MGLRHLRAAVGLPPGPISLAVYVGMQLDHAAREMPNADPGDLYERFVAWTRYRQSTTT